ncbi:hypothetical protein DY000_02008002 [Brassica cretica]|uniref:FACT complex subunit n=1 Tax=Brassica cretica TaxID=69181 RepID=A0ABQ7BZQ3_BRACR|nr:hypothetical protein DY000_02008002 [Brassica cretica]
MLIHFRKSNDTQIDTWITKTANIDSSLNTTRKAEKSRKNLYSFYSKWSDKHEKSKENPGPQGKLAFPDFPPITKIDGVNFDSHSLALEEGGGGLRITLTHSRKTLDENNSSKQRWYDNSSRHCASSQRLRKRHSS